MAYRYFRGVPPLNAGKQVRIGGAFAVSVALLGLTVALTLTNDYPVTDLRILATLLVTVLAGVIFVRLESRPESALIGFAMFRNRQFATSLAAMLLMFMSLAGVLLLVPFYLERVLGYEPQGVGMFLIILPIMMFIFAPLSGRLSDKIGYRILTTVGILCTIFGLFLLLGFDIDSSPVSVAMTLVVLGAGNGLFNTPNSSALMGSVAENQRSVTSSLLGVTRNLGMSLGVAISTTLFAHYERVYQSLGDKKAAFLASYDRVIYVAIGFAVICMLVTATRQNRTAAVNNSVDFAEK